MKFLMFLIFFGLAYATPFLNVEDEEKPAKAMIECVRKALDGGIEEADLPNHNPFKFSHDIILPIDFLGIKGNISVRDRVINDIINFDIKSLNGTKTEVGANYTYTLYWPKMVFDVVWEVKLQDIFGDQELNGTVRISLKELFLTGHWDQTFPTKDKLGTLDGFDVKIVSDINVDFKGLGDLIDATINIFGSLIAETLIKFIDPAPISVDLKNRFNERWLSNGTRIDILLKHCKSNYT